MDTVNQMYLRFPAARRIEHWTMMLSFTLLALTGLPQRFPNAALSQGIIFALGGIHTLRVIHHSAAVVMMLGTAWHLLVMGYRVFVMRDQLSMMPSLQDAKDAIQALLYNVGFVKNYPKMGRYTFEEKMEYWAFVWGAAIMGITGFMMWNPITATRYLPGELIPAAKSAHGNEALLAVLAIIVWHMYGVHIKRFNKAMFDGKMSKTDMLHEHPLELQAIESGEMERRRPDAATLRKRQRIFYPIAALLTIGMLGGIYGFVNAEQTALTTIPPIVETAQPPNPSP